MPYRSALYISLVRTVVRATPLLATLANDAGKHRDIPEKWSAEFYWHMSISLILVLAGGVFAGLTLGLMGLDELHLRVLASSSDIPQQRRNAATVLRLLARGRHWVLVVSGFRYIHICTTPTCDIRFFY
jgi:metal transporter CNNM